VAVRTAFLLRVDPALLDALQRWANDDLRSLNGQIDFVLRRALQALGRARLPVPPDDTAAGFTALTPRLRLRRAAPRR
jgi:hypothetical protein